MKSERIQLLLALLALAFGAFCIHYRIHPPSGGLTNLLASLFAGIDLVVVTLLFAFRSTAVWAVLLNSFLAFLGIILMGDMTITSVLKGTMGVSFFAQPGTWILNSMLPDIAIVVADFLVGLALYKVTLTAK